MEVDIGRMQAQHDWPMFPVLPLKKSGEMRGGILVAGRGSKVFMKNVWALETGPIADQLEGADVYEYTDFEALYDAGWRVD